MVESTSNFYPRSDPVMVEDIESYWEVIRPSQRTRDTREVILSGDVVSQTTAEEQFRRAQELGLYPAATARTARTFRSSEAFRSHLTVRPLIMNQQTYDDFRAMHIPDLDPIDGDHALADGILNNRNPQSFHSFEDTIPLRDLQLALQTLGFNCETWVNEEGRLCIQFHGLDEQSAASPCVGGELRLIIRNHHA